jgi:hypothetical protein
VPPGPPRAAGLPAWSGTDKALAVLRGEKLVKTVKGRGI